MAPSLASFAQYFRIGLEVGICDPDQARDWAFSIIDQMEEPPGEIIEVSWQKPLAQLISDLNDVGGELDLDLVCRWLLGTLSAGMLSGNEGLGGAIRQAMQIASSVEFIELYDVFDRIDDGIHLAESQIYGTVEECRKDFDDAMKEYAAPPFVCDKT
jgi:hypothetical protein